MPAMNAEHKVHVIGRSLSVMTQIVTYDTAIQHHRPRMERSHIKHHELLHELFFSRTAKLKIPCFCWTKPLKPQQKRKSWRFKCDVPFLGGIKHHLTSLHAPHDLTPRKTRIDSRHLATNDILGILWGAYEE